MNTHFLRGDGSSEAFSAAARIRRAVFMDEQGYRHEFDAIDHDPGCIHIALELEGEPAGCARVFPAELLALDPEEPTPPAEAIGPASEPDTIYILGRVAVLPTFRHQGLAGSIVARAIDDARAAGAQVMALHSQQHAMGLYARQGFDAVTPVDYQDEGQPHVWMRRSL